MVGSSHARRWTVNREALPEYHTVDCVELTKAEIRSWWEAVTFIDGYLQVQSLVVSVESRATNIANDSSSLQERYMDSSCNTLVMTQKQERTNGR